MALEAIYIYMFFKDAVKEDSQTLKNGRSITIAVPDFQRKKNANSYPIHLSPVLHPPPWVSRETDCLS